MKRLYLALVFLAIAQVSISAQDCIETVNNSLSIVSKQNFGGPDCLFTIRFCLKNLLQMQNRRICSEPYLWDHDQGKKH